MGRALAVAAVVVGSVLGVACGEPLLCKSDVFVALQTTEMRLGATGQARWIGDVNGDGLADVCWSSPFDNAQDGSFEVLWDARP